MKYRGKVIQIISWETRKQYFTGLQDPTDGEYDFLNIMPEKVMRIKWYERLSRALPFIWVGEKFDVAEFAAPEPLCYGIKRPHKYKVGDDIAVNIDIGIWK